MWSPSGVAVFTTGFLSLYSLNLLCRGERSGTLKLTVQRTPHSHLSLHQYQVLSAEILMGSQMQSAGLDTDLIFQCLGPKVCTLVGSSYYYDPYQARCVRPSLLATLKGAKGPEYPELREACAKGMRFQDYIATLEGTTFTTGGVDQHPVEA
eukprot:Blabericola_migrator_1__1417@NODE_1370_length_4701_cov_734_568623_g914_i1_p3_GENE_NODE_1370_length_4701_cov_734_568623_g914_i1NODE_1370_length_4701_cov_734_568623_g914_i1_p3_ORF_typecomplete_len152_score4_42_NODE_1370_length_4701_cov_734_568623_g914_i134563911